MIVRQRIVATWTLLCVLCSLRTVESLAQNNRADTPPTAQCIGRRALVQLLIFPAVAVADNDDQFSNLLREGLGGETPRVPLPTSVEAPADVIQGETKDSSCGRITDDTIPLALTYSLHRSIRPHYAESTPAPGPSLARDGPTSGGSRCDCSRCQDPCVASESSLHSLSVVQGERGGQGAVGEGSSVGGLVGGGGVVWRRRFVWTVGQGSVKASTDCQWTDGASTCDAEAPVESWCWELLCWHAMQQYGFRS